MKDALRNGELTLKKVLYHFGLIPDISMKALKKEMARFAVWRKGPSIQVLRVKRK